MTAELMQKLNLPDLMTLNDGTPVRQASQWPLRRAELIDLLSREEYGYTPKAPSRVEGAIVSGDDNAFAGKAVQQRIELTFDTPAGSFTFPMMLTYPKADRAVPVFVNVAFRPDLPERYCPLEEIIDRGYALASFCYTDVTADGAEIDGLAVKYPVDEKTGWGKIGMWAFACSRVLDYLEDRPEIDSARAAVVGHSRLGKTALWCGAQDERFSMVISNDSGCSGAAITRNKVGEKIADITDRFPFWFCGNYRNWRGREDEMPFEQHMLLALVAPRLLYVCSADQDQWAHPENEFLGCCAASPAWRLLRLPGLITDGRMPELNAPLHDGSVCYHVRPGTHFFSRTDWNYQMDCRDRHGV
ncbi:MAG: hypothetical protein IJJ23_10255 [Clostridia bacterium]|nr:hypothetical protein [Clostridia bacterium]